MRTIWRTIGVVIWGAALLLPAARAATGSGDSSVFAVNLLGVTNGLTLSGTVVDGNSGNGIVGALVQLGANATVSGSQGAYSLSSLSAGSYMLTGSKPGYVANSSAITLVNGSITAHVLTLYPTNTGTPKVNSIVSKYADSSFYLNGVSFSVQFTANVDWAGHPPGSVQFIAPRNTYTVSANGTSVSQTLAMGSDFGPGGRLQVVAISSDGSRSPALLAGFTVMSQLFPGILAPVWGAQDKGTEFKYDSSAGSPVSFTLFDQVNQGSIPSGIPVFGGKPLELSFQPQADFEIDNGGAASVTLHGLDFGASQELGHSDPSPAYLGMLFNKLVNGGFDSSLFPRARYGGIDLSFYPLLGGGWQYSSTAGAWQYSDAFFGLGGEFSIQQTWPFLAGPVPMFAKAKFAVSAEAVGQLNANLSLGGTVNVNPSLRGSLGVGVSEILSAEGWVEGGVNLDLQWPQTPTQKDFSLYTKAGATVYALLWHWEYSGFYWSWPSNSPSLAMPMMRLTGNDAGEPLGRDYLNYPVSGTFAPQPSIEPKYFGTGGGGTDLEILLTPAMPYSDPNCSSSGTNLYLVFLEDNTNRTSMNRTLAMFSKFNGTLWSNPIALADDGTADFHPRILTFADGSAVAAWENEKAVLPDTVTYAGMESNLEVSVAWYKPTTGWQTARQMTTNNFIDHSPKLAGKNTNNVLLAWIANPANDAGGGTTMPNQIWSAKWNGSAWSAPQLAGTVSNALVRYDLAYDGTIGNLVMSVDTVDNSTNANGHELFRLAYTNGVWGALTRLTSDQVPDDNPQLAYDSQGNLMLTWLKGAAISSALNLNVTNSQVVRTNDYSSNLADFKLANNGAGRLVLLWPEPSENDSDLRAMFYDPIFQTWGAPRQLTHDPQAEHSATAAFYGTNELVAVYDRTMISSTNTLGSTPVDLAALYYTLGEDLALDGSQFNCTPANPSPGSTATLSVEALNLGDKVETNVVVAFYLNVVQTNSQIGRMTLTNAIPPQGSNAVSFNWQVPSTNSPVTVFAVIDPDQLVPDVSRTNNVAKINLIQPNTEIQSMTWSRVASNLLAITIRIINDGVISNSPTTISLNQNSPTGTNLFSQTIAALAPGQSRDVIFLWNITGLPDSLSLFGSLSGSGITNNFSTGNTNSALMVNQVPPPWIASSRYLTNGGYQVQLFGTTGHDYTLLASTDLVNWTPVLYFTCTNAPMNVIDPGARYFGWRFYRIAQGNLPVQMKLVLNSPVKFTTNGLGFNVQAPMGLSYIIQASTNLNNWRTFTNYSGTNSVMFFWDKAASKNGRTFYRAVKP